MHIARWIDFQRSDADDGRWRNWFNARNAIKWWHTDAFCANKRWHNVCSVKWWHVMSGERFDHQDDGSEELPDHVAGSTRMLVKGLARWHGTVCHANWWFHANWRVNAEHRRSNRWHADASRWNINVHAHHHNMFTRV